MEDLKKQMKAKGTFFEHWDFVRRDSGTEGDARRRD